MRGAPLRLADVLEKDWDAQLFGSKRGVATMLGWTLTYHTLRSKGSRSGFPDRVLVRDRVVFVELKRELTGKLSEDRNREPTDEQRKWLDALARAGGEVYLWRPSDLEEIGRILAKRWRFVGVPFAGVPYLFTDADPLWTPRSLWIPGVGRAEDSP